MKVLVVGGGGREHALVQALKRSSNVSHLWCAPGNGGISQDAQILPINVNSLDDLLAFAQTQHIDLTVVGPEGPLVAGIVDRFRAAGLAIVGPTAAAARLEGSKSFAKEFMLRYGIPTARYEVISTLAQGRDILKKWPGRSVIKADGLAAGKGVKVCETPAEAASFLSELMEGKAFGSAGATVVIEDCLEGQEATVMAFCDGKRLVAMPASQDHKRQNDNDEGPNTGGMGAYAPTPLITAEVMRQIDEQVFRPFLNGLAQEAFDFRGIIYFGLMLTAKGPQVLEFNARFGDPETQVVLPLLASDFAEVLQAMAAGDLGKVTLQWKSDSAICIVLASGGYPGDFRKGIKIDGLNSTTGDKNVHVFHAGTDHQGNTLVTTGGRVLGVTAVAPTLGAARDRAYAAVAKISFDGMHYRRDIGAKALGATVSDTMIPTSRS